MHKNFGKMAAMPWSRRPSIDALKLKHENDALALKLVRLNSELATKTQYADRLQYLLHKRTQRIDELTGTIDQLREQNRRLDAEAEHLAAMVAAAEQQQTKETAPCISPRVHSN